MLSLPTCLVAFALAMPGDVPNDIPSDVEVIKFTADWCGPCKMMEPVLDGIRQQGIKVRTIDTDAHPELAQRYSVTSLPTLFIVSGGQIVDRIDQAVDLATLQARIARVAPAVPVGRPPQIAPVQRRRDRAPSQGRGSAYASHNTRGDEARTRRGSQRQEPGSRADAARAEAIARAATVRLRVEDEHGHSYGSGTIVHVHGRDALILTCGHVFRDSGGKGKIVVDLFADDRPESISGQLIRMDLDRDLALVGIRTDANVRAVPIAGPAFHVAPGQRLFSIGCNQGNDPTVLRGQLRAVNKYLGPENLVVSGRPIDGRSGGGLFSYDGRLVGVCNAADPEYNEGLYAAFASVHRHLDEAKLSFVYRKSQGQETQLAATAPERTRPSRRIRAQGLATRGDRAQRGRRSVEDALAIRDELVRPASAQAPSRSSRLAGGATTVAPDDAEIICIIRRNGQPDGAAEVVVLDRPSRQFLAQLSEEKSEQENRQMTDLRVRRGQR